MRSARFGSFFRNSTMIIELFGPPCSGKTTLATTLTDRLNKSGMRAQIWRSSRPSEMLLGRGISRRWHHLTFQRRLHRPLVELAALAIQPTENRRNLALASRMLSMMMPKRLFARAREAQYICRLAHAWCKAAASDTIAVFDQGFIQEIYSLAILSGAEDEAHIAAILLTVPLADVFVHVQAPLHVLSERFLNRRQAQSPAERLLEKSLKTNFESLPILASIHQTLVRHSCPVICVASLDEQSETRSIDLIQHEILTQLEARESVGQ